MRPRRLAAVLAVLALLLPLGGQARAAAAPVTGVASLDVQRYLGRWYQVADLPQAYEAFCLKDTAAHYALNPDGTVAVTNTCSGPFGLPITARGAAKILDPVSRSTLEVSFLRLFGTQVFSGTPNYVVVGIAPDYSWAAVGSPDRSTAYLLSRTRTLTGTRLAAAKAALARVGYDPCTLTVTTQTGGRTGGGPLC